MAEFTEHIDGVLARIEDEWPKEGVTIYRVIVSVIDPEVLIHEMREWARRNRGL